ncbi:hypothetical protein DM860_015127 [Cuscuta australis]|uniref:Uncharacterized protein n=1 Tax=Cuscuta australis TaxID=267555 RepID=A0A328DBN8_9ASTE|nr:hypothetical protein DM860_015127 [Cuscuta australis]
MVTCRLSHPVELLTSQHTTPFFLMPQKTNRAAITLKPNHTASILFLKLMKSQFTQGTLSQFNVLQFFLGLVHMTALSAETDLRHPQCKRLFQTLPHQHFSISDYFPDFQKNYPNPQDSFRLCHINIPLSFILLTFISIESVI